MAGIFNVVLDEDVEEDEKRSLDEHISMLNKSAVRPRPVKAPQPDIPYGAPMPASTPVPEAASPYLTPAPAPVPDIPESMPSDIDAHIADLESQSTPFLGGLQGGNAPALPTAPPLGRSVGEIDPPGGGYGPAPLSQGELQPQGDYPG